MKKSLFSLFLFFSSFINAQNGLECIVVEKYYVSNANDTTVNSIGGTLPIGSVTYRIYADMLPHYTFQAAYGVDVAPTGVIGAGDHELRIQTSTLFFNNQDRGSTTPGFSKARCADNTVMLDSWLSAGAACAGNFGILKTADDAVSTVVNGDGVLKNNDPDAGIPLTVKDGLIAGSPKALTPVGIANEMKVFDNQNDGTNGPLFSTYNGSWSCLGGATGPDTTDNKVLIAQITTDGVLTFQLNIQIGTPTGGIERYVAKDPVGNEISLPCLTDTFGIKYLPPSVSITSPSTGDSATVGDVVHISATASSTDGQIKQVEFFVDGNSVGVDTTVPYNANWTATVGAHNLTATATDNHGGHTTSTIVTITGKLNTGINEINSSSFVINVFPSPAKDFFELQIFSPKQNSTSNYCIRDIEGKVLFQKHPGSIQGSLEQRVDISAFASGLYFVEVTIDGFTVTKKIIKN